ncbi:phage head spike fiber domain-containing protein [Devosia ginsengisoli]|uniref:Uncharacterized protein n=1 Tax=Devosia ginsengisoli TaxID=400770 RepID=A0A5B8LR60_9HYPH|nr:hypothetical protein FPZ08_08095 [Devosia ginsengisoli]
MRVGVDLWMVPGAGNVLGASYVADFAADLYFREGLAVEAGDAFSVARNSVKYAADGSGSFTPFAAGIAARTDRGLSVEPASSNLLTDPVRLSAWLAVAASATPLPMPLLGIFAEPMLLTGTGGTAVDRLRHPTTSSVSNGASYALSYWFQPTVTPTMVAMAGGDGARSRLTISVATAGELGLLAGRGTMTLARLVPHGAGVYCAQVLWTPNFSGVCEISMGPGTGVLRDTIGLLGAFMEPGTAFTGPMIGTGAASSRAADRVTLHLPAGTHELIFTFDDMTTQVIAGAVGDYAVPTDLDRPVIRSVIAMPE